MIPTLALLTVLSSLLLLSVHAAITTSISRNGDYIEQNARNTFCFYPKALDPTTIDVACVGSPKGDYAAVLQTHLNQSTSINYFSGSLERLGGPEWVFNARGRKSYLCMSGRAGDYTYQTMCTTVSRDNSLGNATTPFCKVQAGQRRVTDGCYVPNQVAPPLTVVGQATSTPRPAVVTVTRTSASGAAGTSTITRTANGSLSTTSGARFVRLDYIALAMANMFIYATPYLL